MRTSPSIAFSNSIVISREWVPTGKAGAPKAHAGAVKHSSASSLYKLPLITDHNVPVPVPRHDISKLHVLNEAGALPLKASRPLPSGSGSALVFRPRPSHRGKPSWGGLPLYTTHLIVHIKI